jgi:hypothetical protein
MRWKILPHSASRPEVALCSLARNLLNQLGVGIGGRISLPHGPHKQMPWGIANPKAALLGNWIYRTGPT